MIQPRRATELAAGSFLFAAGIAFAQPLWHGPAPASTPATAPDRPPAISFTGNSDDVRLARAIALKYANPAFAAARSVRGRLPPDSHGVPEEQAVRQARDRISFGRRAPAGATPFTIPRAAVAPAVDGAVGDAEWRGALRITLEPAARGATVLLLAHGDQLYLAALAPGDRTSQGFDQFRFWYHLDLSPFLENERAMISGQGSARTLRATRLPRAGEVIRDGMDLGTLVRDTDWGVAARLRSATVVAGFRRYEVEVDLSESGIAPGVPFPAFFEIEGDPESDAAGKFKARVIEGQSGSASQPLWLRVAS